MNESEWRTRKQRIDTKLRDAVVQTISVNATADRPHRSLSASTGERVRVRCRFEFGPNPKVVVTVDVPSRAGAGEGVRRTGEGCGAENIPALEFIVFLRPVKSRILWVQMIGRSTRKCPDLNKSKFVVFDCFDGTLIHYSRNVSRFDSVKQYAI